MGLGAGGTLLAGWQPPLDSPNSTARPSNARGVRVAPKDRPVGVNIGRMGNLLEFSTTDTARVAQVAWESLARTVQAKLAFLINLAGAAERSGGNGIVSLPSSQEL